MKYLVAVYTEKILNPKMGFDSFFMRKHYDKRVIELQTMVSKEKLKKLIQNHYKKYRFLDYLSKSLEVKYYLLSDSPYSPIVNSKIYYKFDVNGEIIKWK